MDHGYLSQNSIKPICIVWRKGIECIPNTTHLLLSPLLADSSPLLYVFYGDVSRDGFHGGFCWRHFDVTLKSWLEYDCSWNADMKSTLISLPSDTSHWFQALVTDSVIMADFLQRIDNVDFFKSQRLFRLEIRLWWYTPKGVNHWESDRWGGTRPSQI